MALVSASEVFWVPDNNFVGVAGAHRILGQIKPQTRRLVAPLTALGTDGALALFRGLPALRQRYSADPDGPLWGITEFNLVRNSIGDAGLLAALKYAGKDSAVRTLLLHGNEIALAGEGVAQTAALLLNKSRLAQLGLTDLPLDPAAVSSLFGALNAQHLHTLHLSTCDIPSGCAAAIADYVRSPRSRGLKVLELNENRLGRRGVSLILDAVEAANFSLLHIGLMFNDRRRRRRRPRRFPASPTDSSDESDSDDHLDNSSLAHQLDKRVPALQFRNEALTARVRRAASRAIAPARIILCARSPTATETAARVMHEASRDTSPVVPFALLDLPAEVQVLIARHCSRDAAALSEAQWTRLRLLAADPGDLRNAARKMRAACADVQLGKATRAQRRERLREVRDEWLVTGGWECWELNRPQA
ncbi:uncharacterized protein LOC62_04G006362 [Vanrija pseudolonga]|uniref:F-box domain-containing protein n=1 Tax=Vanrija pseudolonga TaxID=143232 RepID=A0AAF0YDK6_9TREE|nr:hypothetical protein LOC62_04G006362 [Vanrija pseudolonga]